MDVVVALARLGGFARWPALAAAGVSRGALLDAVRLGLVRRPARGVFCLEAAATEPRALAMVARGQLSCAQAAVAHGLETFTAPGQVHVRIPERATRLSPPASTTLHRWGRVGSADVTPLLTTLRDCATCLAPPEAVAVLDSALRSGRVTERELSRLAPSWPTPARRAVNLTDALSQSVLESVGRVVLIDSGIGPVSSQVAVPRVGRVDLVVDGWLVVELDGYATHRASFQEDRRRDAELTRLGYVVLRFTYNDLLHRRDWFVDTVLETLDRGQPPLPWPGLRDDFAPVWRDTP